MAAVTGRGGMKLYVNGVQVGAAPYEGSFAAIGNGGENYLGRSNWTDNADFQGRMDEVRIWSVARTTAQIRATMHRDLSGSEEGLAALWNFEEGDARDSGPRGHHGLLQGDARCVVEERPQVPTRRPAVVYGQLVDGAGQPVGGAAVHLEQAGNQLAQTQSDAAGRYSLAFWPAAPTFDLAATLDELGTWALAVRQQAGTRQQLDLVLEKASCIDGQLLTFDQKQPHVRVLVEAVPAGPAGEGVKTSTLSDAAGYYRFVNLKPGPYRVRCQIPGGSVLYGPGPEGALLQVKRGEQQSGIDLYFAPFKKGTWKTRTYLDGLADNHVTSIFQDDAGVLWLGTKGGLSRYDGTAFRTFTTADGLANNVVLAIHRGDAGVLWLGTEGGLSRYDGTAFRTFTTADGLANNVVLAIHRDANGTLWLGTEGGLSRYDGTTFQTVSAADGFVDNAVLTIYQENNALWLGTAGEGLWQYDGETFSQFTLPTDRSGNHVRSICRGPAGELWLGTAGQGIWRFDGTNFFRFNIPHSWADDYVRPIYRDASGSLWIGTVGGGVWRYDGVSFVNFTTADGLADDRVWAFHQDEDGVLWMGTEEGISWYDDRHFSSFTTSDGLIKNLVWTLHRDAAGLLWMGTWAGGISRYDGEDFVSFTQQDGLSGTDVRAVASDAEGFLWAGALDWGLSRYDGREFVNFTTADGLVHDDIRAVFRDAEGILWVGTRSGGVGVYDGAVWTSLDTRDGLAGNWVEDIYQDEDGSLLFATDGGVTRYRRSRARPRVRITAVQSERLYEDLEALESITTGRRVTISYRGVDFKTLPEKRQYRYRLREIDSHWRPPTSDTHFEWIPETAGTYTFEVQAIDRDLNYSESARLVLQVVPPWYLRTWIALPAGGGLLALLLLSLVSSRRYYRQRREAQRLREQMLEQEHEAREELEGKNAQLETSYAQVEQARDLAEQASQAKSVFLANMSHEIRTPMNAILGYAQILQQETQLEDRQRHALETIQTSGNHLLGLINDVLDLSRIEAGHLEVQLVAFDLHGLVQGLGTMFELRCAQKGLQWQVDIAENGRWVHGDENKLRQVLINLLGNAVKFTQSGAVSLHLRRTAADRCHFEVCDTGPGILPERREQIFQPFVQLESDAEEGGTGLGLTIAHQRVEAMGGRLEVAPVQGGGSRFYFDLPLPPVEETASPGGSPGSRPGDRDNGGGRRDRKPGGPGAISGRIGRRSAAGLQWGGSP